MSLESNGRVAILFPGDLATRRTASADNNRFANLFQVFTANRIRVEPAVYHDDFRQEVFQQLMSVDAVLVWSNPIESGRDRTVLDAMLRDVAAAGIFVSTHPDIILKLGTKEVLHRTRSVGWACDTHLYESIERLRHELPLRLAAGKARVLKQNRGHSGNGVWKVQLQDAAEVSGRSASSAFLPQLDTMLRVQHAKRGCHEERMSLREFFGMCEPYFAGNGQMIDQEYQERLIEGMVRCYLVHDKVAGFGHQAINALFPAPAGAPPSDAPQPGPRLYHPPTQPEFQALKRMVEQEWVPAAQRVLAIDTMSLPILWDCDFLFGPKDHAGGDTYVLCEINVSSVAPYPESAVPFIVEATVQRMSASRQRRGLSS